MRLMAVFADELSLLGYSSAAMTDKESVVTLAVFTEDMLAQMLAEALESEGIDCQVEGGITSGFRAEAPTVVKVIVHRSDEARAKTVFEEWEHAGDSIDWDDVDLGEMEDGTS